MFVSSMSRSRGKNGFSIVGESGMVSSGSSGPSRSELIDRRDDRIEPAERFSEEDAFRSFREPRKAD